MKPSLANLPPELVARCLEFTPVDEVVRVLACDQRIGAACAAFRATTGCAVPVLSPTCLKRMLEPLRTIGLRDRVVAVAIAALDRFLKHAPPPPRQYPCRMLQRRAGVVEPMMKDEFANAGIHTLFLICTGLREYPGGEFKPVLLATATFISARVMQSRDTIAFAAFDCHKFAIAAELDYFGIDLRVYQGYANLRWENEAHFFLDYAARLRHGARAFFGKTLGFTPDGVCATYNGCAGMEMWPAPDVPARERLEAARTGPFGLLDLFERRDQVRQDLYEIFSGPSVVTGDVRPAKMLFQKPGVWTVAFSGADWWERADE